MKGGEQMMQYELAVAFMTMDVVTGLLQAIKNRDVNSSTVMT